MWWFLSKKLTKDEEILETLEKLRTGKGRDRNVAFVDLRDTFQPLLRRKLRQLQRHAESRNEINTLQEFIESTFFEILLSRNLKTDDARQVKSYIKKLIDFRLNDTSARKELGKTSIIKQIESDDIQIRRGLKKYHDKYKKLPDLKNSKEVKDLAKVMDIKEKKLQDMLRVLGNRMVKSLYDEVGGDDEGNVETLMDVIDSGSKLPDEIYKDRELARAFQQAIQRYLRPIERKVFQMYYFDPKYKGKTKQQLAKELDIPFSTFKHHLDKGKEELQKSPVLKEFKAAYFKLKCLKLAMSCYEIQKIGNNLNLFKISGTDEELINEVIDA